MNTNRYQTRNHTLFNVHNNRYNGFKSNSLIIIRTIQNYSQCKIHMKKNSSQIPCNLYHNAYSIKGANIHN